MRGVVGTSWLAAAMTFAAVHASRIGCIDDAIARLAAIAGVAAVSLAAASILLVAVVPTHRSPARTIAALAPLGLSVHAMVTLLARNRAICG